MNVYLDPPKPNITEQGKTSRWIYTTWSISEISYIQSFDIFKNDTFIKNFNKSDFSPDATNFSYNYTEDIAPFQL